MIYRLGVKTLGKVVKNENYAMILMARYEINQPPSLFAAAKFGLALFAAKFSQTFVHVTVAYIYTYTYKYNVAYIYIFHEVHRQLLKGC